MPLLKLARLLHDIVFDPLSILSDFKDKSQYYFPNLDVSGRYWVREQFCHQLDFFDLQIAKKVQLIDSAACRLRFKLPEMNSIHTFLYTEHCTCRYYNYKRMFCILLKRYLIILKGISVYLKMYIYIYNT